MSNITLQANDGTAWTFWERYPHEYTLMLGVDIVMPHQYAPLGKELKKLTEQDVLHVYLAGVGGVRSSGIFLIGMFKRTKAHVVGHVIADCYSAHAMVALGTDELVFKGDAKLHVHAVRLMNHEKEYAKDPSLLKSMLFEELKAYTDKSGILFGWLSENEVRDLHAHLDKWIDFDETEYTRRLHAIEQLNQENITLIPVEA